MSEPGEGHDLSSVRALEMRLFEEVGNQLKAMTQAVQSLASETRDVRERVIRIEALNQPEKLTALESNIGELFRKANAKEKEDAELWLANEKRMTRIEVVVAPFTVGGAALLAAVIGAVVAHFIK